MLLCEMFSRRLSDLAMRTWVEALAPHYGPHLVNELTLANKRPRMASLGEILEATLARTRGDLPAYVTGEEPTPEERERNRAAAKRFFAEMRMRLGYEAEGPPRTERDPDIGK